MKTPARYACVGIFLLIFVLFVIIGDVDEKTEFSIFDDSEEIPIPAVQRVHGASLACSMSSCFNFSRCDSEKLKVFVYNEIGQVSEEYSKMLRVIRESPFYTNNSEEACLFVLGVDSIDRDKISENFVPDLAVLVSSLPSEIWRDGRNHVIFNLFHGTYPDYSDHSLGFETANAIVARASASTQNFRSGFDLSLPLFTKAHPMRDSLQREFSLRSREPYLVSFKGKRYVYGIGSETRDTLHHMHNGHISPMVTTCRHNTDWQAHQDDRCEADNEEYDKWDYEEMMLNSTFCLTPRGRRLGSFRFLESLRIGCIPVVLSDDWELPFSEAIDWSAAIVRIYEKNILLVLDVLSTFPLHRVMLLRQRGRLLYHRHFASVEKITLTALKIVFSRVRVASGHQPFDENRLLPFDIEEGDEGVTVVMRGDGRATGRLQRAIGNLTAIEELHKVIVLWPETRGVFPIGADFGLPKKVQVELIPVQNRSDLSLPSLLPHLPRSGPVLFLSDRSSATTNATVIHRMLRLFRSRPHTIVTRDAIDWPSTLDSSRTHAVNLAYLHASVVHSGFLHALPSFFPVPLLSMCLEATLGVLVADLTMAPPTWVKGSTDKWDAGDVNRCMSRLRTSRYPMGPPLISTSLGYSGF